MANVNPIAVKKRLIYAEDLFEPVDFKVFMCSRSGGKTMAMYEELFRKRVEMAPTIDAVEVVRCKDCKFWVEGRHHTGRCNALIQFHDAERYATDEGYFCSYGERRTNGSVHI